jgi:hypothetical protein
MGIFEVIVAVATLGTAVVGWLAKSQNDIKKLSRGQLIGEAEKMAYKAVEVTKRIALEKGKGLTKEDIWNEFKKEAWKYASGKGIKGFTANELEHMKSSAEVISRAAKNGLIK